MVTGAEETARETTTAMAKRSLKAARKNFRERVGKIRAVMKFGMTVEERVCEIFSAVTKEMVRELMDDVWRAQGPAQEGQTEAVKQDLDEIKTAMQALMTKVAGLETGCQPAVATRRMNGQTGLKKVETYPDKLKKAKRDGGKKVGGEAEQPRR
ncbi:hypothetical protein RUM44_007655 [Polyplax serrata]|uniref:Uncharacterized protein n=1 Tax=Polyplax serrata TaxID=468196 RepID=A0ABR1BA70_POLSC